MVDRLFNGKPFKRTNRLTRDVPMTPLEKLGEALEKCIVGCQGRRNAERAQAVLDVIRERGWAVVPREATQDMCDAGGRTFVRPIAGYIARIWDDMVKAAELTPPKEDK